MLLSVGKETSLPHLKELQAHWGGSGQGRGRKVSSQMEVEDGYFNENYRESFSYMG